MATLKLGDETAKEVYTRLESERKPYISRAEQCAHVTIPSLFPKDSDDGSTTFKTPYQSLGARGINNLASQILLAIMPPTTTFFRLDVTEEAKKSLETPQAGKIGGQAPTGILSEIQYALSKQETTIMKYYDNRQFRVTIGEGIKQALVAGNYLFFLPPKEGGIKGYRLNKYVVERDGLGKVIRIVAKDVLSYASLPKALKPLASKNETKKPSDKVEIYTHTYLSEDQESVYESYQEIEGEVIKGSEQTYPEAKCPWIAIRMVKIDGENYARSYIEEILGDLNALEGLSKAILQFSAIASRIINVVNPNGMTSVRKLNDCPNGGYVSGRAEDVVALQLNKSSDFQVAKMQIDSLKGDLALAFLLNSAVQRNAERVTAEEIRYVARELENGLGGIYSILSQELQLPLVRVTVAQLQNTGILPQLPPNTVEPSITTGIEALGRGQDLAKLDQLLKYLVEIPNASDYMKIDGLIKTIATALSIDVTDIVRTLEEVQQIQQQAQEAEMAKSAVPNLVSGAMQQGGGQPPQQ